MVIGLDKIFNLLFYKKKLSKLRRIGSYLSNNLSCRLNNKLIRKSKDRIINLELEYNLKKSKMKN